MVAHLYSVSLRNELSFVPQLSFVVRFKAIYDNACALQERKDTLMAGVQMSGLGQLVPAAHALHQDRTVGSGASQVNDAAAFISSVTDVYVRRLKVGVITCALAAACWCRLG